MFNRLFNLTITRVALLVGALMAISLVALPVYNLAFAQETGTIEYPENGTGPVATFTGSDPEEVGTAVWDLLNTAVGVQDITGDGRDNVAPADVADMDDFDISDAGVLTFKESPDFEVPVDDGNGNEYRVTVRASDGATGDPRGWYKVVVTVTDMEEPGKIRVTVVPAESSADGQDLLQFQPGAVLTAALTDPDSATTGETTGMIEANAVTWDWSGEGIGNDAAAYTVTDTPADKSDVGKRLTVTATYADGRGDNKTATYTTPHPVQIRRLNNTNPVFAPASTTRTVAEDASNGASIGIPVAATDADGDILTYSLADTNNPDGDEDEERAFGIDKATGQLEVNDADELDADVAPSTYVVTVTATDSMGNSGTGTAITATVTITVTNVNEKPDLTTTVVETQKIGRIQVSENMTELDADPATDAVDAANYAATDPESGVVTLSTSGADGSMFELNATDADDGNTSTLAFESKPDFEMPMDSNKDNVYEVTVVATDGNGLTAMKQVTVKVTNVEEAGKVTLPTVQPRVGVPMTATLTDSDIFSEASVTWAWHRLDASAAALDETGGENDTTIDKATSATYTPVSKDKDMYLQAKATYFDMTYYVGDTFTTDLDTDTPGEQTVGIGEGDDRFSNKATSDVSLKVDANPANSTPEFEEGTTTERFVKENTPANAAEDDVATADINEMTQGNIGGPVMATDDDGDTLIYTLGGRDKDSFDIDGASGQIEVAAGTMLDYDKTKKTYMVTVTANDSTSNNADASASIAVAIRVTNVDEAPAVAGRNAINYPENGKGPVATFTGSDPEGVGTTVWDLLDATGAGNIDDVGPTDVADMDDFEISDTGMLTFKKSPDFEVPVDDGNGNEYRVTVRASDGATGDPRGWHKVVVTVTDMEEPGKIRVTVVPAESSADGQDLLQFQPGAVLTAALTDPDSATTGETTGMIEANAVTWDWSGEGSGNDAAAYTVTDTPADKSDVGKRLTVTATYTDRTGDNNTATYTTPHPVQTGRDPASNTLPEFAPASTTRTVAEDASNGASIGIPVAATDADGDILTYSLADTNNPDGDEDEERAFGIDKATGQLEVNDADELDADVAPSTYVVTVTATDSMGGSGTATVTITVTNVNEKPDLTTTVVETQKIGRIQVSENMTELDADPATDAVDAANYAATDPESGVVTLSTSGADGSMFELNATDADDGNTSTLAFESKPDFEMPTDSNKDNVYEVTVVATDGNGLTAMKQVTVKVTNVEEAGKVTLPTVQPRVGVPMTATLTDSDIFSEASVTWAWHRLDASAAALDETGGENDTTIDKATSATYTPVSKDKDMYLQAKATYFDMTYYVGDTFTTDLDTDTPGEQTVGIGEGDDRFSNKATSDVSLKVDANPANSTPEFEEGTTTERFVKENTPANAAEDDVATADINEMTQGNIGGPVMATDDDGDTLIYTLGGRDKDSFDIDGASGQIEVAAGTMLDYDKTKKTYMVTVTANDSTSNNADASASIAVAIRVTNVDEAPKIMVVPTENQAPMFPSSSTTRSIPEGQSLGRDIGARVTATDPNPGDSLTYTLEGTDAASFSIHSGTGQLRTSVPLDQDTKSTYTVIVKATDRDGLSDTITVTITVTDAEEQMGEVTLWDGMDRLTTPPQVGDTITGLVEDPDGGVTGASWQWARMDTAGVWMDITGATDAAYMVTADDEGYYLRVMATYMDAVGTDTAMEYSPTTMMVGAEVGDPLLTKYDDDKDGWIQLNEARDAVGDYFVEPKGTVLSLEDAREVVGLYFEYKNSQSQ